MERNGSLNLQTQYMVGNVKSRDFNSNTDKYFKQACENLDKLSFVGITEQFQDSAFLLCQTFGWKKWYYMPQNVSKNKKQIHLLKTNFSSRIAQLNQLDQELYDRGLEIFNNQKRKTKIPLLKKYEAISLGFLKHILKGQQ